MKKNLIFYLLLTNLFFICTLLSGCGNEKLSSDWRDRQIVIDGKYTDWGSAVSYYNEKAKVVINLLNDADYLYICLITRNRKVETELMESGFVVWFDPDAGNKKTFGILFPIGLRSMGISLEEEKRDITKDWQDQEDKSGLIDREKERWRDKDFNKHLELLEGLQNKLKIMQGPLHPKPPQGNKKEHPLEGSSEDREGPGKTLSLEEAVKFGIEAKVGRENDYFVYELKVPLVKSVEHPYAIEVKTDKPIGLGLEISMFGMGMRGPGEMGPSSMYSNECFPLWATVTLSSK